MSQPHKPHCYVYRYAKALIGADRRGLCTCETAWYRCPRCAHVFDIPAAKPECPRCSTRCYEGMHSIRPPDNRLPLKEAV